MPKGIKKKSADFIVRRTMYIALCFLVLSCFFTNVHPFWWEMYILVSDLFQIKDKYAFEAKNYLSDLKYLFKDKKF